MHIIILGPPGSGKGTHANFIFKKYHFPHISTGDMLRTISNERNKKIISKGQLVEDQFICDLIKKRLKKQDCKNGFILDGFPRTIIQAKYLEDLNINLNYIIELYISEKNIFDRINGRLIHQSSGRTYHKTLNPPIKKNKDDITGEDLILRTDDKISSIKDRIEQYKKFTKPLIKIYRKKYLFYKYFYHIINANNSIINIQKSLKNVLKKIDKT
ncbi:MAG: nucleoside monophosphate kinase [Arsenophonus sp.]|nr:MAG: nucleoside monophosphate kinase [Arsenophonus sp.]